MRNMFSAYIYPEIILLDVTYKLRGGWPCAELHYGSILQFASVDTISRGVRTSGEATKDPLKSEFLSSFRC